MACVLSAADRHAEHPEESTLTAFLLKTRSEACAATGLYLRKPRHRNTEKDKNYLGPDPTDYRDDRFQGVQAARGKDSVRVTQPAIRSCFRRVSYRRLGRTEAQLWSHTDT